MDQILQKYNETVGDVGKLKKLTTKVRESQPVIKKPAYQRDDDGWITVHNKKGIKKRKKEEQRHLYYYSFEKKEAKLLKHQEMLAKFEEDKKRLKKMKEARKFKIK